MIDWIGWLMLEARVGELKELLQRALEQRDLLAMENSELRRKIARLERHSPKKAAP